MTGPQLPGVIRTLLRLYPRSFRRRYGTEYEAFLVASRNDHVASGGRPWVFWLGQAWDIAREGLTQRLGGQADRAGWATGSGHDARQALRMVRRDPFYVLISVAALALGIGATTAIFTVVDQTLLRPLPYAQPDELVQVYRTTEADPDNVGSWSWPDFVDLKSEASTYELSAYHEATAVLSGRGDAEQIVGVGAHHSLFDVLRARPLLGRTFLPEEDVFDGPKIVMLAYDLWATRFGSDPGIVGRSLDLGDGMYEVVGVMPAGFAFPDPTVRFWVPLNEDRLLVEAGIERGARGLKYLRAVGRLAPGVGIEAARSEIRARVAALPNADEASGSVDAVMLSLAEFRNRALPDSLLLFLGASVLVLVIACANVAGVTLSRGAARGREFALRSALGAPRLHTVRLVLAESLVLGVVGCLLAVVLGGALVGVVAELVPETVMARGDIRLDGRVLAITIFAATLTALASGLTPALRAGNVAPAGALAAGGRGGGGGPERQRAHRALIVAQLVLSVVLLSGAGLFLRSFAQLRGQPLGFDPEGILTARIDLPAERYEEADGRLAFYREVFDRVQAIPGVSNVSATYSLPFSGTYVRTTIELAGEDDANGEERWARSVIVDPRYLKTMSVPLLSGRQLTDSDDGSAPHVAVINEVMARTFWPGEDPIGKVFRYGGSLSGSFDSLEREYFDHDITVVGVAAVERREALAEEPTAELYRPYAQIPWWSMALLIRTEASATEVVPQLREAVRAMDASLPLEDVATLREVVAESAGQDRLRSVLSGLFAAVAAVITMVGIYGVTASVVSRRQREIGIRLALGAQARQVRTGVLASGLRSALGALLVGIPLALLASRWVSSFLFQVSPLDPVTYGAVAATVLGTTVLACYIPARRASRVAPMEVMTSD